MLVQGKSAKAKVYCIKCFDQNIANICWRINLDEHAPRACAHIHSSAKPRVDCKALQGLANIYIFHFDKIQL